MKILVIGETCRDVFVYGKCERLTPEAPVPVFQTIKTTENSGMAGNVFNNIISLGFDCELATNSNEIIKTRYVEEKSNQMLLRVDHHDFTNEKFNPNQFNLHEYDCVVVSDYNKGFLTNDILIKIGKQSKFSFIDTKKYKDLSYFDYFDFIKMNEAEWEKCVEHGAVYEKVRKKLIITKSQKGCEWNGNTYEVDNSIEVRDVSGAGDTWTASFVVQFLKSQDIETSIMYANKNATIVVQKRGVSVINEVL